MLLPRISLGHRVKPKNIEATDHPQTDRSRGSTTLAKLHWKPFIAQYCWPGTYERFTKVPTSLLAYPLTRSCLCPERPPRFQAVWYPGTSEN